MNPLIAAAALLLIPVASLAADAEQVERGRYLAIVGDCAACHTAPGGAAFAGGLAIQTPFGTLISPNITPDMKTGIGGMSDAQFLGDMHTGVEPDGHFYPAFPYPYFTKATDEDVLAIHAWLNTLAPVSNEIRSNQLPFPFNIRATMRVWNAINFTEGRFVPVAGKSAAWNRGAYLVEGLAHCGACHTAKNMIGGDDHANPLQGGVLNQWFAPNLTGDTHTGIGGWSLEQITQYLQSGHNDFSAATGPMAEVVAVSTSQMTDADRQAIAIYLKAQPGQPTLYSPTADAAVLQLGAAVYDQQCASCHTGQGTGVDGLAPAFAHAPSIQAPDPINLVRAVLLGAGSVATTTAPTGPAMPAFGWKLSDQQIAAVLTYVRASWGNSAAPLDAGQVRTLRDSLTAAAR
jgi:mono/diheme cytochrome c family protein